MRFATYEHDGAVTAGIVDGDSVHPIAGTVLAAFHLDDVVALTAEGSYQAAFHDASGLVAGHAGSYMNRAQAIYRHFLGEATDKEPPAAR